jgi:hypothetical protein
MPALTEVLGHLARCARRELDEVVAFRRVHGDVEGVLTCVRDCVSRILAFSQDLLLR